MNQIKLVSKVPPYKPASNLSVQSDGTILYKGTIGWFSVKKVAEEYGYVAEKGCEDY